MQSPGKQSRILVVLPTLGERLDTLQLTLESINNQRNKVNLTLVVVLPKTAVKARKIASAYGATIVDDPKNGISDAINCGISARSSEEFYAWMGDDDLFREDGLYVLQELMDGSPEAVVAYGGCDYINPTGKVIGSNKAGKLAQFLLPWGPDLIPHPGSIIRLDYLESIGLFDSSLKYAMDLDVFLKLKKIGKFVYTNKVVSAFRWHPNSLTVSNRRSSSFESEFVKAKHLPGYIRPFRFIWQYPIRWASYYAANTVSRRA